MKLYKVSTAVKQNYVNMRIPHFKVWTHCSERVWTTHFTPFFLVKLLWSCQLALGIVNKRQFSSPATVLNWSEVWTPTWPLQDVLRQFLCSFIALCWAISPGNSLVVCWFSPIFHHKTKENQTSLLLLFGLIAHPRLHSHVIQIVVTYTLSNDPGRM